MPKRKSWEADKMKAAVVAVRNREMGYLKASKTFNVPQSTLERYVRDDEKDPCLVVQSKLGRKPVFSSDIEEDLANYCLTMEERFFGLSQNDVRRMAFQLSQRNNIQSPFNKTNEKAGQKWLKNFLRRHPRLSIRTPRGLSLARATAFTPEAVKKFFDIFEPAMEDIQHAAARLYNADETGITVVQHKHTKIVGLKVIPEEQPQLSLPKKVQNHLQPEPTELQCTPIKRIDTHTFYGKPRTSTKRDNLETPSTSFIRATDITPVPNIQQRASTSSRSGSAVVITSSPYMKTIESAAEKKAAAERKKRANAKNTKKIDKKDKYQNRSKSSQTGNSSEERGQKNKWKAH
ncbi:hypothetical protein MML48_9g00004454 [Holotrichia oblita]|uniref:Uncharacterized protein n=1 Tax=Holotrichia oblita TaxID=644536 RepID=A0ACB9SK31_HOLOL|nr:hypothetical protein MML48_9g00004454 [Holotrichia oblita]